MGLLSGITSAISSPLGSLGLGIGEKVWDNYEARKAAKVAFDRERWMASNKYQMMVGDLKAAGINPLFSVMGGSPGASAVPMAQPSKGTIAGSTGARGQASLLALQGDNLKKEGERLVAEKELAQARTMSERARPENIEADTGLKRSSVETQAVDRERIRAATTDLIGSAMLKGVNAQESKARTEVAKANVSKIFAEIVNMYKTGNKIDLEARLLSMRADELRDTLPFLVQGAIADSFRKQLELPALENMAEIEQEEWAKVLRVVERVLGAIPGGLLFAVGRGKGASKGAPKKEKGK